jgi:hypothetical protein
MDAEACQNTNDVPQESASKPKRVLTEAQLRSLAEGRKKAIETRKKMSAIKTIKTLEKKKADDVLLEEAELTIKRIKEKKPARAPLNQDIDESPVTTQAQPLAQPLAQPPPPAPKKSAKETYYELKIRMLQQKQAEDEQQQYWQSYQRAPSSVLAQDIARQTLMARANKAVIERAYKEIFPDD